MNIWVKNKAMETDRSHQSIGGTTVNMGRGAIKVGDIVFCDQQAVIFDGQGSTKAKGCGIAKGGGVGGGGGGGGDKSVSNSTRQKKFLIQFWGRTDSRIEVKPSFPGMAQLDQTVKVRCIQQRARNERSTACSFCSTFMKAGTIIAVRSPLRMGNQISSFQKAIIIVLNNQEASRLRA